MDEYIFEELGKSSHLTFSANEIRITLKKKERIVRCRGCGWYAERTQDYGQCDLRGHITNGWCFCAWGEPKEVE